ncbi:hypothetical protein [Hymenobacter sp. BT730]|uniref:hypothetical protein n=1 Tax=Hymenobacter sp. BT730 TaxID=3063332 RepID=UPI0026E09C76|nr:hypothetical protein [Hymenobacter sp. BT730]
MIDNAGKAAQLTLRHLLRQIRVVTEGSGAGGLTYETSGFLLDYYHFHYAIGFVDAAPARVGLAANRLQQL